MDARECVRKLILSVEASIKELSTVWNAVGTPENERKELIEAVMENVGDCFAEAVDAAKEKRANLEVQIDKVETEIQALATSLGEPWVQLDRSGYSLLKLSAEVQAQRQSLLNHKEERQKEIDTAMSALLNAWTELEDIEANIEANFAIVQGSDDMSRARLDAIASLHADALAVKDTRIARDSKAFESLVEIAGELEESPLTGEEGVDTTAVDSGKLLPKAAATALAERLQSLTIEKAARASRIAELTEHIAELRVRLDVSADEAPELFSSPSGLSLDTVSHFETQWEKLNEIRAEQLPELVSTAQREVDALWDNLCTGPVERSEFTTSLIDMSEEEQLAALEALAVQLQTRQEAMGPGLIKLIRRRQEIIGFKEDLEESIRNPARLFGKGGKRDPGRLLREEKMRKAIKKELPRVEAKLQELVPAWEEEHPEFALVVNDTPILELIARDNETETQRKQADAESKAAAKREQTDKEMRFGSQPAPFLNATVLASPTPSERKTPGTRRAPKTTGKGSVKRKPLGATNCPRSAQPKSRKQRGGDADVNEPALNEDEGRSEKENSEFETVQLTIQFSV